MTTAPPKVPKEFMRRLKAYDPKIGIEWLGDHFCLVDESKEITRYKRYREGIISWDDWVIVYDRIHHLKEGQLLDSGVINELQKMNMNRWGDHKNYENHINKVAGEAEIGRKKEEQDFRDATVKEVKTLKRFGVTVPGRRDAPNTSKD